MEIIVTGVNHKRAPVELREKLAVEEAALSATLGLYRRALGASEMVILSTCNRVEYYAVHEGTPPALEAVAGLLAERHGVAGTLLVPALYRHEGAEAVRHLFRVASSLDSMVVGEAQILGQVKEAYEAARESGATGRILNRLFQKAAHVAGRIRSTTAIGGKSVSVPSVAAKLAEKVFQDLTRKTLLVLGAGETGELTLGAFRARGITRIHVVNRTLENARALAVPVGGQAHSLGDLDQVLPLGDIVISCLRSDSFVLSVESVETALRARRREPMFLIDLGVPRNIHPGVNAIDNVYLYNVDHLETIVQQNVLDRSREMERASPIVEQEAQGFLSEIVPPDLSALLSEVRKKLETLSEDELKKTLSRLNGLSDLQRQEVQDLPRRIVNKILHPPSQTLRESPEGGPSQTIIELIRKLFGINK